MAMKETLSHSLDGALGDRLTAAGYEWTDAAENIAAGQTDAAAPVRAWMNDKGHHDNILSATRTKVGVGVAKSASGKIYFCQDFAKHQQHFAVTQG
jgi:uncharacterized protein YkwD